MLRGTADPGPPLVMWPLVATADGEGVAKTARGSDRASRARVGACPQLAHVQSATWLLQGTTQCPVERMCPGSSVAGSFGTQRSGVQISPTRLQLRRHFGAACCALSARPSIGR